MRYLALAACAVFLFAAGAGAQGDAAADGQASDQRLEAALNDLSADRRIEYEILAINAVVAEINVLCTEAMIMDVQAYEDCNSQSLDLLVSGEATIAPARAISGFDECAAGGGNPELCDLIIDYMVDIKAILLELRDALDAL